MLVETIGAEEVFCCFHYLGYFEGHDYIQGSVCSQHVVLYWLSEALRESFPEISVIVPGRDHPGLLCISYQLKVLAMVPFELV